MVNTVVAKTATSKKAVDFRDGLVMALPEDYAMLFGVGGKKHAPTSGFRVTISDYSAGTGDKCVTCSAFLEMETVALLAKVAEERMSHPVQAPSQPAPQKPAGGVQLSEGSWTDLQGALALLRNSLKQGTPITGDSLVELGTKIRSIYEDGKASLTPASAPAYGTKRESNADFAHNQVRVHAHRMGQDGLPSNMAPVQTLTITRTAYDQNGCKRDYPWVIKIANGAAEPRFSDVGAVTYNRSTYRETGSVFMNVSDEDMFRMTGACQRLISAYTIAYGVPLVRAGVDARKRERQEYQQNQQQAGAGTGTVQQPVPQQPAQPQPAPQPARQTARQTAPTQYGTPQYAPPAQYGQKGGSTYKPPAYGQAR